MQSTKTIGHEKQKQLFERAVKKDRLAHAYAFVGEEGIGKADFARELAVTLLGSDPAFDVFNLGEEGIIRVEEARSLQRLLALSPIGKYKIAVIRADALDIEAGNALLKTLEEPSPHSILFLITSNFYNLLPTIASRVQKVVFYRAADLEIQTALEEFHLGSHLMEEIVKLASGRVAIARRLAADEQFLVFTRDCAKYYQGIEEPRLVHRLKTSEIIAALPPEQIKYFLRNSMRSFTLLPKSLTLGQKLSAAARDIEYNVNVRLAMDNLFL